MQDFEVYDVMVIPLIVGLVAVAKRLGAPDKSLPLLALALGVVIGVNFAADGNAKQGAIIGAMFGLSASGLYSGGKAIAEIEGDSRG